MDYRRKRNDDFSEDLPTYSRLFIVCERSLSEDQLRDAFSKFGRIEDIRIPRDHNTGEPKGIAYIKFFKTSEAAAAMEEMHLKVLPDTSRSLKVMVACNRSDIQTEENDNEKYKRIFINVAKSATEDDLEQHFSQFGHIDSIIIQKDRNTGESRGFAYIKFRKFSHAALAFENCDKKYRAIFAQPKGHNRRPETSFESNINNLAATTANMKTSVISMMKTRPGSYKRVNFMCAPYINKHQIERLFDIIPGMAVCQFFLDLARNCGKGTVSYTNPVSAAYAVEKLNNFEYPPGSKIFVRPDNSKFEAHESFPRLPDAVSNLRNAISATSNSTSPDLAQLAEAISEASKLIKMATAGVTDDLVPDSNDLNYCSAKLPPTQPLADIDSPVAKRCFLVCKPQPPPLTVLRDVFCRFGQLINVYTLPNKTVGYARYATVEAADAAIATLHGAEICGVRMKVIEAEEEAPAKRMRYNDNSHMDK